MQRRLRNTLALAVAGGAMLLGVGTAVADEDGTDALNTDSVSSSDATDSVSTDSEDTDTDSTNADDSAGSPLSNLDSPLNGATKPADVNGLGGLGGLGGL